MIRRTAELDAMELRWQRDAPFDPSRNLEVYEAMYQFARESGALKDLPVSFRIAEKIRFALAINGKRTDRSDRPRP